MAEAKAQRTPDRAEPEQKTEDINRVPQRAGEIFEADELFFANTPTMQSDVDRVGYGEQAEGEEYDDGRGEEAEGCEPVPGFKAHKVRVWSGRGQALASRSSIGLVGGDRFDGKRYLHLVPDDTGRI